MTALPEIPVTDALAGSVGVCSLSRRNGGCGRGALTYRGIDVDELVEDYRLACISRALDDRQIALQKQSRAFFQISGAGHEALLLALARHLEPGRDWFFPYYRDMALMLGLGMAPLEILLASVGSAEDPSSAGRQMPSHWSSRRLRVAPQTSPTGSQCLPAVGCAEAGRYIMQRDLPGCQAEPGEITYVSLGEGATSEGEFWESLNSACILRLPVLFLVADNGYAISVPSCEQSAAPISQMVQGFAGLDVRQVDGCDYFDVRKLAAEIVPRLRDGYGPVLVHAQVTRPYSHSSADNQAKYRGSDDLSSEAARDPLVLMARDLAPVLDPARAAAISEEARELVGAAARQALAASRPDPATVREHLLALPEISAEAESDDDMSGPVLAMGEGIRRALYDRMALDERMRVFGEDVADAPESILAEVDGKGGVFGSTIGLQRAFGVERCYNAPLAEANIVGRAIGQAMRGLRPVPEIQFFDYIWPAMQQIRSEAATMRWRTSGEFSCPMVLRVPIGGYLAGGAIWHSQSGESIFAHIPGLIVLMPSTARDAVGLLRSAFDCEDPVLFLEHKHLLRQPYTRGNYPSPRFRVPLGRGSIVREGSDCTIVTYGALVEKSRRAAATLAQEGASVEIIDLRSLVPWDSSMVAESVARTSRLVVVHEDTLSFGFGAEVAAWVSEHCFGDLDAPVIRVGALDTWVAYEPTLEQAILPQVDTISDAVRRALVY